MKTKITSNDYDHTEGTRVTVQVVTYTRADDLRRLGELLLHKANLLDTIAGETGDVPAYLTAELERIEREIDDAQANIDGYTEPLEV